MGDVQLLPQLMVLCPELLDLGLQLLHHRALLLHLSLVGPGLPTIVVQSAAHFVHQGAVSVVLLQQCDQRRLGWLRGHRAMP